MNIRLVSISLDLLLAINLCMSVPVTDSVSDLHRISSIVQDAWSSCTSFVRPSCIVKTDFCQENILKLSFEEWEDMKPGSDCKPVNTSMHRICKLLFFEFCNEVVSSRGSVSWKHPILLFVTVILPIFFSVSFT